MQMGQLDIADLEQAKNVIIDNSNRIQVQKLYIEEVLSEIQGKIAEIKAHMFQLNQNCSETQARFFYELKQQRFKRKKLT